MRRFYVYVLDREEGGPPFYVGKGVDDRINSHEKAALAGENSHKARVIRKVIAKLGHLPKRKIVENLDEVEAFALEVITITTIGRYPNGPLVNKTDGGEGVPGLWTDSEILAKAILSHKATWLDPVRAAFRIESMRLGWERKMADEKFRAEISAMRKAMWNDLNRGAVSRAQKSSWEEDRDRRLAAVLAGWGDPKERARRIQALYEADGWKNRDIDSFSKKITENWSDPEYRAEQIERINRVWDSPEVHAKASVSAVKSWKDPERAAKRAQAMREGWARRRVRLAAEKNETSE